jgi:short-subunit dehydrogenase involved in D-alanine esterification of teichoic acids
VDKVLAWMLQKDFLEGGAKVIIWDIDQKLLDEAVKLLNNENLTSFIVDVSNYKDVENTVNDIISKTMLIYL